MARRTKHEMEQMKSDARFYLLRTNNQPQPAFELMVKECLEAGESIPYYMKDIKDFIKVSQELALELNRVDQMGKRDREQAMAKESIINYILNISVNEIKSIYKKYKDTVTQSNKLVLHDVYMMIYSNDMKEEYINASTIRLFSDIMAEESNSVKEIAASEVVEEVPTIEEVTEQQLVNFTNVEIVWNELKSGNKVLMNNDELDSLQGYINTLSDEEQDVYYSHFSSLFDKQYACGLLTRSYVCELKNITKEEDITDVSQTIEAVSTLVKASEGIIENDQHDKLSINKGYENHNSTQTHQQSNHIISHNDTSKAGITVNGESVYPNRSSELQKDIYQELSG